MTIYFKAALGMSATMLFAATAQAGGISDAKKPTVEEKAPVTQTVKTIDADGQVGQLTIYNAEADMRTTAVLGAFEQQATDAYIVEDNEGRIYINHIVPVEELPDPTLSVETVDSYTTEYRGQVFTNKVVDAD